MTTDHPPVKMPELPVFLRALALGFLVAEIWRISYYLGTNFAPKLSALSWKVSAAALAIGVTLCVVYAVARGGYGILMRVTKSYRVDLLAAIGAGLWANVLAAPWLSKMHDAVQAAHPQWAPAILTALCIILISPLVRTLFTRTKAAPQLYFISDEEIEESASDVYETKKQAIAFANTVLESGAHSGLVFGVDGPWGVGKTSFINLAQKSWDLANDRVIVCRFEPLRYASESDVTDRLVRELTAAIQRKAFSPEFRPAASRYSRLIRGKADVSFLGFKLTLEPGQETVEDLIEDIDAVLKRINRRVIIVIDDLDRLDAKTINSVLFATRRALKLSQATYVLCYDTEMLLVGKDDDAKARAFLEKFVTVKLSLFVDSDKISGFLRGSWKETENHLLSVPSDTMLKLSAVLDELADILDGNLAPSYLPLVGDLRKIKRLINAMLLMQLEKSDLGRTDFNRRDLINLILLNLNYPGIFRRLYAEETEGRRGTFSVRREHPSPDYKNSPEFADLVKNSHGSAGFLLEQLFDANALELEDLSDSDEAALSSRACFNHVPHRNLEKYLKLIVRFSTPAPQETFILYQRAVDRVKSGKESIASTLDSAEFSLAKGEAAHDQFWRVLVNQAASLPKPAANEAIQLLIHYIPLYSSIDYRDRGLRPRSIYSLLRLLDRAGWGTLSGGRSPNSPANTKEIAWRIFGEELYKGEGILNRLVRRERGPLGWNDLMLFRLQCSADRRGQLHNLQSALIHHQDPKAPTTGLVRDLAIMGMRHISQEIFELFRRRYIVRQRNFYDDVDGLTDEQLLGLAPFSIAPEPFSDDTASRSLISKEQQIASTRVIVKSFVMYQLSNQDAPTGSGVGCGYYDTTGNGDNHGISRIMSEYVFDICFNPTISDNNALHFVDHCLSHLSNSFFTEHEDRDYIATKAGVVGGFGPSDVGRYWIAHRDVVQALAFRSLDRTVITSNYIASYREDLPGVFEVLDELARDVQNGAIDRPSFMNDDSSDEDDE